MKKLIIYFFLSISFAFGQKDTRSQLIIPPKQVIQIDYPFFKGFNVKIWNQSKFTVGVSTKDKLTDSIIKSFNLEKKNNTLLEVSKDMYLQFENQFIVPLKISYIIRKGSFLEQKSFESLTPQRAFYLENNTAQSLPLSIPGVVSPKLSPFSRSGVNLPNGQKIYLNFKGDKILILTVTDSIAHGTRIDVAYLIEKAMNKK